MWGGEPQPLHVTIERNHSELFAFLLKAAPIWMARSATYDGWTLAHAGAAPSPRRHEGPASGTRRSKIGLPEALLLGDDARVEEILTENPAHGTGTDAQSGLTHPHLPAPCRHCAASPNSARPLGSAIVTALLPWNRSPLPAGNTVPWLNFWCRKSTRSGLDLRLDGDAGATPRDRPARHQGRPNREDRPPPRSKPATRTSWHGFCAAASFCPTRERRMEPAATLLHTAAWKGNLEIARMLIEAGANPNEVDAEYRTTPLVWAQTALERLGRENCRAVMQYLAAYS